MTAVLRSDSKFPALSQLSCAEGFPPAPAVVKNNPAGAENFQDASVTAEIEIAGTLRLVGSARAAEMVVTTHGGPDYYLEAEKSELERLKPYQGRKVRAFGVRVVEEYKYPDPKYNHTKHILVIKRIEFLQ